MSQVTWEQFVRNQRVNVIPRSQWFNTDDFAVYLRAGPYHTMPGEDGFHLAIGISNINVRKEREGKGVFRNFIMRVEELGKECGYAAVRVEEVHNKRLAQSLIKHGYVEKPHSTPPTYVKKL